MRTISRLKTILTIGCSTLIVSCGSGDGNVFDTNVSPFVNTGIDPVDSTLQSLFEQDVVEVPEIRWSLVGYQIGGMEPVEVEAITPDANWVSNNFITDSLANPDQTLATVIECDQFSYDIEITSVTTFSLGIAEIEGTVAGCLNNTPEGLVRGVFADLTTILVESIGDGSIAVSNGNGTILTMRQRNILDQ